MKKKNTVPITDSKNILAYWFWITVNKILLRMRFKKIRVSGREYLPDNGSFILLANHQSRWDGLIVYQMIGRLSNFMVSPNELKGLQGSVLRSAGAFPACPRSDTVGYSKRQIAKGEGIVIFPEGDIFTDGKTHPFKHGAARLLLESNPSLPVIPCAIHYSDDKSAVELALAPALDLNLYHNESKTSYISALHALSQRLHREISFLRYGLGEMSDKAQLFAEVENNEWLKLKAL